MNKKRLGLAIGKGAVAAVLAKKGRREVEVVDSAHIPVQGAQTEEEMLASALQSLARSMDLSQAACAVSLPASEFFFRNLRLPFSEERKIRQVLPYELEPLLAGPVENLIFDFQVFQTFREETAMVVGAATRDRLSGVIDHLNGFGLDPAFILPRGLAWARQSVSTPGATSADTMALYTGAVETTLLAFRQGQLCLVRTLARQPLSRGCEPALARDIVRTAMGMTEFMVEGFSPDQLLVTKRSDMDLQALQRALLSMKLEIVLQPWTPPSLLPTGVDTDPVRIADAFALAVSAPGCCQGLNFRRGELGFEPIQARKKRRMRWGIGLAAGVGLMFMANLAVENHRMAKTVDQIDKGMTDVFRTTFPETSRIVDPLHQMRQKIKKLQSAASRGRVDAIPYRVTEILSYLSRQVPRSMDVALTQMVVGGDQMTLAGETDSYNTVNEMKNRMAEGGLFALVEISTATVNRKTGRIQFTLKVGL